ncbi:DUF2971 domain-containing protein [Microbacterium lacticum]|uniref:DUF2971 domain-containing protein n=1 Tax=Microbacterium lacticum TaxID=33885 RepID=UPI0018B0B3F3|nr:DUF2971 domain-containing protein [Microbacterium lacticum]MBF9336804.1 DUF2971 domain-containing protein [Microbacterium lacticum]
MTDAELPIRGTISAFGLGQSHKGEVWHYTDSSGLVGILTSRTPTPSPEFVPGSPPVQIYPNGTLRATAATQLNDFSELQYGAQRIIDWYEAEGNATSGTIREHVPIRIVLGDLLKQLADNPAYVCCASTTRDSLEHWRGYAGEGGYALKLDAFETYTLIGRPSVDTGFMVSPEWVKVRYLPDEQDELIHSVFTQLLDPTRQMGQIVNSGDQRAAVIVVQAHLAGLAAALKHPSFEKEDEVRLIVQRPDGVTPDFRASRRGPVPYLTLGRAPFGNAQSPTVFTPLPVSEVLVGPPSGDAMEQRVRGTRTLLDAMGRAGVPVNRSELPYLP